MRATNFAQCFISHPSGHTRVPSTLRKPTRQLASGAAQPTHLCWVEIVPQVHGVHVDAEEPGVDLVRVHSTPGVEVLCFTVGKYPAPRHNAK